jgi:hypothetical protein
LKVSFKILISICFLFGLNSFSQNFEDDGEIERIFETHLNASKRLIHSRGASSSRLEFQNYSITDALDNYQKYTAVILYTFINDSLASLIITKDYKTYEVGSGRLKNKNYHIVESGKSKKEVISEIDQLSGFFSSQFSSQIFSTRGAIASDKSLDKSEFHELFKRVNSYILPNEFQLENVEQLIIVPSVNIGTLPFAAMKIGDKHLIDQMNYSIAPSIDYIGKKTDLNSNFQDALFVANPDFPKDEKWNFQSLPGTVKEVNQITSKLKEDVYQILQGSEATKERVLQKIKNHDLLYFATHGYSDPQNSLDKSFIALAGKDPEDAFLTPREIQQKDLKARLVVLSACQTGLGVTHDGGVIGLSRAFLLAGAENILMSLWNINDGQTAKLMSIFFKELIDEEEIKSPHEALRDAILKYKNQINSDPKYWAAFSIFGVP